MINSILQILNQIQYHCNKLINETSWLYSLKSIREFEKDKNKYHKIQSSTTQNILSIENLLDRQLQREQRINFIIESTTISLTQVQLLQNILLPFLDEQKQKEKEIILFRHELLDLLEEITTQSINKTVDKQEQTELQYYIQSLDIFRKQTEYRITLHREQIITEFELMDWLEQVTHLSLGEVLFDSYHDDWSSRSTILKRIINKHDLLFLVEDTDNELFGGYIHEHIPEQYDQWINDSQSFLFNLKSQNNRLSHPMKFEIKQSHRAFYLHPENHSELLFLGCHGSLCVFIKEFQDQSICDQYESAYHYHGIENALCGKEEFIPKRITVIQMKT